MNGQSFQLAVNFLSLSLSLFPSLALCLKQFASRAVYISNFQKPIELKPLWMSSSGGVRVNYWKPQSLGKWLKIFSIPLSLSVLFSFLASFVCFCPVSPIITVIIAVVASRVTRQGFAFWLQRHYVITCSNLLTRVTWLRGIVIRKKLFFSRKWFLLTYQSIKMTWIVCN